MSQTSYSYKHINQDFLIFKALYVFGRPLFASKRIKDFFNTSQVDRFGVIEKRPFFGIGYIGIAKPEDYKGEVDSKNILHIEGTFHVAEFVGEYQDFLPSLKQVKRENPFGVGWHNVYLNRPGEENKHMITWVLFQNEIRV